MCLFGININLAILASSTLPQIILKFSWHVKALRLGAAGLGAAFYSERSVVDKTLILEPDTA